MLSADAALPLVLFTVMVLVSSLHGLAASGHFPRAQGAPPLAGGGGVLLYATIAVAVAGLFSGLIAAFALLPWYAVIIGGGMAVLIAPLVLQRFPDSFVDGRAPLLLFSFATAALALALWVS